MLERRVSNKRLKWVALWLSILCFATYGNSLKNEFVLDDHSLILQPSSMHHSKHFFSVLTHSDLSLTNNALAHYRPVSRVFRFILYQCFQDNPFYYHVISLVLFFMFCFCLFIFIHQITDDSIIALIASTLFCVHPINTMPVNFIAAQEVLIYGLLALTSLIVFFLCGPSRKRIGFYLLSLLLFVLSLLTQEIIITFPLYIFLIMVFLKRSPIKTAAVWSGPYFLIALGYLVFRMNFVGIKANIISKIPVHQLSLSSYMASLIELFQWYLLKLFSPYGIVFLWNVTPSSTGLLLKSLGAGVALVFIVFLLFKYWKMDLKSFFLIWFLIGFIPVPLLCLIYVEMGMIIEPHWFFFSSIGFFALIAFLVKSFYDRFRSRTIIGLCLILAVALMLQTRWYNAVWRSQKSYCIYWLSLAPDNHGPNFWLGHAYLMEGQYDHAQKYFHRALINGYIDWQVHANLGLIAYNRKERDKAVDHFLKALAIRPDSSIVSNNIGLIYREKGELNKAKEYFEKAFAIDPFLIEPRLNLADLYKIKGDNAKAADVYKSVLEINPNQPESLYHLAEWYIREGDADLALKYGKRLLKVDRDTARLNNAGGLFAGVRVTNVALKFFKKSLKEDPRNIDTYLELGKMYGNLERFDQAIDIWQQGLAIAPDNEELIQMIQKGKQLKESKR